MDHSRLLDCWHGVRRTPARALGRMSGALAVAGVLVFASAPELLAQAQQPQPQQAPRPQPRPAQPRQQQQQPQPPAQAQPAQPAPQQQAQQQQLELIYSPWVKLCNKEGPSAKQVCVTVKDGRVESGQLMVSVAVIELEGEQRKLMRVSMPYGVNLQHGSRMIVDQGAPATSTFVTCLPPAVPPGGCITDYDATADLLQRLKRGKVLTLQAIHMSGEPMSPQMTLTDFAKAYDGPPTDPKVFEEQQRKMQEEFQKRQQQQQPSQQQPQPQR